MKFLSALALLVGFLGGRVSGDLATLRPNATLALHEQHLLQPRDEFKINLSRRLLRVWPPFAPVTSTNEACRNDSYNYLERLSRMDLNALKMYDASAKLPSGLLSGNVNHYGDFNECIDSGGRYCLTYIDIKLSSHDSDTLHLIHDLMHAHYAFRSTPSDPGHRVPRYSSIHWAVCVPNSCTPNDVESAMNAVAKDMSSGTGLTAVVNIKDGLCQTVEEVRTIPHEAKLVAYIFLGLVLLVLLSTVYDYFGSEGKDKSTSQELFLAFSLIKNGKKLFSLDVPADDISSVHGIRCLNAVMLYLSHKSMALFFNPYVNRTFMTEMLGKPWTVIARAASLYTDPFIMMSGLLTSYSLGKQLQRSQSINVPKEIISRLMRLLPTLGALILFCTFILPYLGSGPQWPLVVNHHADLCKKYWWRNMMFIHNYFGFQNMCLTHTHHIGIDTQLFFFSPIFIYLVYKWPKQGLLTLLSVGIMSTILRFYTVYVRQLNLYVYFGNPVKQMFNTADYSYILPTHRATVYVMGIALGYILRTYGKNISMKKSQLTLGWFIAFCMLYQSIIQPSKMGDVSYVYDKLDAANYSAFAPITWCLFFSWIIFTSHTGNAGFIGRLSSWRGWQITTRLSYAFYLTQFPVFFYNVGRLRHTDYYSLQLLFDIKETIAVIIASIVLCIMVEMPFQNIRTVLLKKPSQPLKQKEKTK